MSSENPRFDVDTVAAIRRLDRVLKHHDATVGRLRASETELSRQALDLIKNRIRRLQADIDAAEKDRAALADGLARLGIDVLASDAGIGRSLRRVLGLPKNPRQPGRPRNKT